MNDLFLCDSIFRATIINAILNHRKHKSLTNLIKSRTTAIINRLLLVVDVPAGLT